MKKLWNNIQEEEKNANSKIRYLSSKTLFLLLFVVGHLETRNQTSGQVDALYKIQPGLDPIKDFTFINYNTRVVIQANFQSVQLQSRNLQKWSIDPILLRNFQCKFLLYTFFKIRTKVLSPDQGDQIGLFLKDLGNKFSCETNPSTL